MWLRIDSIKQSPGLFDPKGGAKICAALQSCTKETPHNDAPQIGGYRQLENR